MKTVTLTDNDLTELRFLRRELELKAERLRREVDQAALLRYKRDPRWSPVTTDEERSNSKALELLNRLLR